MFERGTRMVAGVLAALALAVTMAAAQPAERQSPTTVEEAIATGAGDAARGARLFTGEVAFAQGGAPCLGCHGIAGFGLAGGANYGPDLTSMFENFGDEGIADILKTLPFPSMEPIYATRPLTDAEQADLRAFFAKATGAPVANNELVLVEVLSGALIFFGVVWLFGRERLSGVRQALVKRAGEKKEVAA